MRLRDWLDLDEGTDRMSLIGLSNTGARTKAQLLGRCAKELLAQGAELDRRAIGCYCPGRLEIFGKHTDYAGGRSLIAAPELGIALIALPRKDATVRIRSLHESSAFEASMDAKHPSQSSPLPKSWARYPATAIRRLTQNANRPLLGADILIASDLPIAAGMSSSSALLTATLIGLMECNELAREEPFLSVLGAKQNWAMFASCVENGQSFGPCHGAAGVGTFGGSEDHTAMLCGRAEAASQYSFSPIELERRIPIPANLTFVVVQSGILAEKATGALERYNNLSKHARAIVELANQHKERLGRDLGEPEFAHLAEALAGQDRHFLALQTILEDAGSLPYPKKELAARLVQFHTESEVLIPSLPEDWTPAHWPSIAKATARSVEAANLGLHNQVDETLWLTEALLERGAIAASPFGAGFGGSVWGLVERTKAPDLIEAIQTSQAPGLFLSKGVQTIQAIELGPGAGIG